MVNLKEYQQDTIGGVILNVEEMLLSEWLKIKQIPDDKIEKWSNLDRQHICLTVIYGQRKNEITTQFMIPQFSGYMKSNLKKFVDLNKLPLDTDEWPGKLVKLRADNSGFLRVAL